MNKNFINTSNQNSNNSFYSLLNIENYKHDFNYSTDYILNKHSILLNEYLNFIYENIKLKNKICTKFIIIRGIETVSHVFSIILHYSKNIDLAFYHGQKAFYFYVEFISQTTDEHHSFLQLNSRDASLFVYKKTIFDINNDYRKNTSLHYNDFNINQFEILYTHSCIIKQIIWCHDPLSPELCSLTASNIPLLKCETYGYKFHKEQFTDLYLILSKNR